ncbi:unnamed protein product, partial [Staurois parvus]
MGQIVEKYNKEPGKGLQAESALQDFIMTKESLKISIMNADDTLTEQQKKDEENKSCRNMEDLENKIKELKLSQESKIAEDKQRTAEMNYIALMEKQFSENRMLQEKL